MSKLLTVKNTRKCVLICLIGIFCLNMFFGCNFGGEVQLNSDSYSICVGETKQVSVTINDVVADNALVRFSTSDPRVMTVDENGVLTAVSGGEAIVTVSYGLSKDIATVEVLPLITEEQVNTFGEEYINIFGRCYVEDDQLVMEHVVSGVEVAIVGTYLTVHMNAGLNYIRVYVDEDTEGERIPLERGQTEYKVAENLEDCYHKIRIVKCSELMDGSINILSFHSEGFAKALRKPDLKIEFIGASISTGYGSLGTRVDSRSVENSDGSKAYAYYTAQALNADFSVIAWSGICWNVSLYGDRPMKKIYPRISPYNQKPYDFSFQPDVVVIELGTNESHFLGNNPSYGERFKETDAKDILKYVRSKNPDAYILWIYGTISTNRIILDGIKLAIEELGDEKIQHVSCYAGSSGPQGHPTASEQAELATQVINAINAVI